MKQDYETLYNSIMNYSADGIIITDLEGNIVKASHSVLKLLGIDKERIIGFSYLDFISSEDHKQAISDTLLRLDEKDLNRPICYHAIRASKDVFYLEINTAPIMDSEGHKTGLVMIFRDVTERKIQEEEMIKENRKLAHLSITDSLTGIANRRYFEKVLQAEYARHIRMRKELAIIIADIDYFKNYNDFYGHLAGDVCLRKIAKVLDESVFRSCDLAARYGGEEFAIILPDTDAKGALLVAERIRHSIMNLAITHEASLTAPIITISMGIASAICNIDGSPSIILEEADKMLYKAKNSGRNRVVCFKRETLQGKGDCKIVPIEWLDDYASGDSMIDSEHHVLIDSVNGLLDATLSRAKLEAHADNLPYEMASHFHNEERLMCAVNYPGTDNHIKEHMKLLNIATSLVMQYKDKRLSVEDLFSFFAYEFLEPHLLRMDSLFFPYLSVKKPEPC